MKLTLDQLKSSAALASEPIVNASVRAAFIDTVGPYRLIAAGPWRVARVTAEDGRRSYEFTEDGELREVGR